MYDPKKAPTCRGILLSLFGFVLLWAVVSDAWGYSARLPFGQGAYVWAYLSRLVWAAPAIWLIARHGASLRFGKGELFSRPVWNRPLIVVLAASAVYVLGAMLATHGGFWLNPSVNVPLEVLKFALVGAVEETVFRGWGYNALSKVASDTKAAAYSTAFFVLLHWPAYFIRLCRFGAMDSSAWLLQSLSAAVWGVLCCRLLKKGKTLWNPVIAHAAYDALCALFVG